PLLSLAPPFYTLPTYTTLFRSEGVTFHDGSEFDSTDVVYSYNRIIDEQLANAYRFASVADVQAPDPQTVVITLSEPTPALLSNIDRKSTRLNSSHVKSSYDVFS